MALALGAAAVGFERVARGVVVTAVTDHLSARSREVLEAVRRFQRERELTASNWAEAEAMQLTLDSGDPKFAEDYMQRTIQDQGGTISAAALVGPEMTMLAGVRVGALGARRGEILTAQRTRHMPLEILDQALQGEEHPIAIGSITAVDEDGRDEHALLLAHPVKDFTGDVVAAIVVAVPASSLEHLLLQINGSESGRTLPIIYDAMRRLVLGPTGAPLDGVAALAASASAPGQLQRAEASLPVLAVRSEAATEFPGWTAAMTIPEGLAYGTLASLRVVLGGLFLVVLGGAAVTSVWAVRTASSPLTDVAASMSRVAGGDLTTRIPAAWTGELGHLVRSFNTMVGEVARSRDELQRTEALRREVQIAHAIQTAILPQSPAVPGFEVAARMKPADDVGGDLYDVLAFPETFWLLVGDVSGHGINSGLVMMMAQAAAYGAVADNPSARPRDVFSAVNRVVHENVRNRMGRDDYLTFMAARHLGDGRFLAAGAHQPVFILRTDGSVEVVEPRGPWVGLAADLSARLEEYEFRVGPGEAVCFITDGIVEATAGDGQLFGEDRLVEVLRAGGKRTASQLLQDVFAAAEGFAASQADDMTAVILRRTDDARQ